MLLLATLIGVSLTHAPVHAHDCDPEEVAKLLASDGAVWDFFGSSVAISGDIAIVGAAGDDDNGSLSGSAYLFDANTGQQLFKLLPSDGAPEDRFGNSVAISGDFAIAGASTDNDNGRNSGSAYVFDANTGQQLFKLLPSDGAPEDRFGDSVAISGDFAVVGATGVDDNGENSGAAYIYRKNGSGDWIEDDKLLASDGTPYDDFGYSVSIDGNVAVIGALDDDNGYLSGSAYVFEYIDGEWTETAKLLASDGAAGDYFGISVAMSGDIAIVGAVNGSLTGSAYLFDVNTGQQLFKLLASDGAEWDQFGKSVAISRDIAIVGAPWVDDNGVDSGSAYLFDVNTGEQLAKLLPIDGASDDQFGWSVAISGDIAVVGAYKDDDSGEWSGSAYLFELNCGGDSPTLSTLGSCPGPMRFKVEGATANGRVAYLYARGEGSVVIPPGNPCAGTTLGLNATVQLAGVERADGEGVAILEPPNVPNAACGRIYVEALDLTSCASTNVVLVP